MYEFTDRESILLCLDDSLLMAWKCLRTGWSYPVHTGASEWIRPENAIDPEQIRRSLSVRKRDDSARRFDLREMTAWVRETHARIQEIQTSFRDVNRNTVASPIDDLDAAAQLARTGSRGGARDGAAEFGLLPGVPRRPQRRAGSAAECGRADLRHAISAAQVQGWLCASTRQQYRPADPGRRLPPARQRPRGSGL